MVELAEEVSRDIPFERNATCDNCGRIGAFDYMGDYWCGACSLEMTACFYADPPTLREFFESLIELFRMGIKDYFEKYSDPL